jgi:hypothetical protein
VTTVLVTWHDAHSGAESWINIKDLDTEPAEVQSVGFLLATSDGGKPEHVTLYQSRNEDSVDHVLHIPVGMVKTIKVLMDLEIKSSNP